MDLTLAVHSLSLRLHSWGKEGERGRKGRERGRKKEREREGEGEREGRRRRERGGKKVGVLDMK